MSQNNDINKELDYFDDLKDSKEVEEIEEIEEIEEQDDEDFDYWEKDSSSKKLNILIGFVGILIIIMLFVLLNMSFNINNTPKFKSATAHDHKYSEEYKIIEDATCYKTGLKAKFCTLENCEKLTDEIIIEKLEHDWTGEYKETVAATCSSYGKKQIKCKNCSSIQEEKIEMLTHNYTETSRDNYNDCEKNINITYECTYCESTKTETKPSSGHKLGDFIFTDLSNIDNVKYYKTCSNCGIFIYTDKNGNKIEQIQQSENIQPTITTNSNNCLSGYHVYGTDASVIESTCSTNGTKTVRCVACGIAYVEELELAQHKTKQETTNATCSEQGIIRTYCEVCGLELEKTYTNKAAHKWNDGKVSIESTCVDTGLMMYECLDCGTTKFEDIPSTGSHSYSIVTSIDDEGEYTKEWCEACGHVKSIIRFIEPNYTTKTETEIEN